MLRVQTKLINNMAFGAFACVDALRPAHQFFSHDGLFSCIEPVLSSDNNGLDQTH